MSFFLVVLVVVMVGLVMIRLGMSIRSTRRLTGQGTWSTDGAEIGGVEPYDVDHRGHHQIGHHDVGHHNAGGHHNIGGHDIGGGGGHVGGGHHG